MTAKPTMKTNLISICVGALAWLAGNLPAATLYVDLNSPTPTPPYTSWATAATNIQTAIDAASAGDTVLVTNGIYASGGKVMFGDLTNRVAVDKALTVMSLNGYAVTVIQGAWDTATNGPNAVRCVWLTNGATLKGFTLRGGATRSTGDILKLLSGGGAWCVSNSTIVLANCLVTNNAAAFAGGGLYQGTAINCAINNNVLLTTQLTGGGAGALLASLTNCTVTRNKVVTTTGTVRSGGTYRGKAKNSIVFHNTAVFATTGVNILASTDVDTPTMDYCCASAPLLSELNGTGNITNAPLLGDNFHLLPSSPCRGAGSVTHVRGLDFDGEAWTNPPSMGCDEPMEADFIGVLSVALSSTFTNLYANRAFDMGAQITGLASAFAWDFGDGSTATNLGINVSHTWTNAGSTIVTVTAYNTDNPAGVSATLPLNVLPLNLPQMQSAFVDTNGFQFQFFAQSNLSYIVQRATNLLAPIAWKSLVNKTPIADGFLSVTNPVTNPVVYYRLQVL
ncbi:MAG: hypothetical protein RL380_1057 [Verrucomicrobiota bacterium]|jgi:hypothetical protein